MAIYVSPTEVECAVVDATDDTYALEVAVVDNEEAELPPGGNLRLSSTAHTLDSTAIDLSLVNEP